MMKKAYGFNATSYQEIKATIKTEIPFRVSVSRNRAPKSHYKTINIKPIKKDGTRIFSENECIRIIEFIKKHNLGMFGILQGFIPSTYKSGFTFISQIK